MTDPEDDLKELNKKVTQMLRSVAVNARDLEPDEVSLRLDEIESTLVSEAPQKQNVAIEIKRRVAEWKFSLLEERHLSFEDIESLYQGLCGLGFQDLEREATYGIIFARFCLRRDEKEIAVEILDRLDRELEAALQDEDLKIYRHLRQNIEKIRTENAK